MSQLEGGTVAPDRPAARGRGGYRVGAGRKRKGGFAALKGDVAYAKNLVSALMRDESQPAGLRARCALAVLNGDAVRCRRSAGGGDLPLDAAAAPTSPGHS